MGGGDTDKETAANLVWKKLKYDVDGNVTVPALTNTKAVKKGDLLKFLKVEAPMPETKRRKVV